LGTELGLVIGLLLGFAAGWLILGRWLRRAASSAVHCELLATKRRAEKLEAEARTDPVTGLRNRRAFDEELGRLFAQRQRQGTTFSLILADVDDFKAINDRHGHLAGDAVLRVVAETLRATLREMDLVCRFGGDEFAVICAGSSRVEATVAAERARQAIARTPVGLTNGALSVTISLGVAETQPGEVSEGLIRRTDEALYAAKQAGRNLVRCHDGEHISSVAGS
jgi:diguanylate cyclase (GGDEF)-like protein